MPSLSQPRTSSDASRTRVAIELFGVALLAGLVRALPWGSVFHGNMVVFAPADAMYHVRRAYYTFVSWPDVLLFDSYVNYPDGAPIPWPPLTDFLAGTLAVLVADDDLGFETILAWWPPLVGALGAIPIYFITREIASRGAALGAVLFYALLPISVIYGRVGNPDHHVAVAAVGATLLLLCVQLVRPDDDARRIAGLSIALGIVRAALLMTWHGSLLYIALAESTLVVAAAFSGRHRLHAAHAASALLTLGIVAPILSVFPEPLGGLYSSIAPSRLHLIAIAAVVVVAGAGWWRESGAPAERSGFARLSLLAAVGLAFGVLVLALPGPREGLEPAFRFMTMTDAAGSQTAEQFPLFAGAGKAAAQSAIELWGFFAYLIPLLPLALFAWSHVGVPHDRRYATLVLAAWAAFFGFLTITQRRYGNDLSATASVGFAVMGALAARGLRQRFRVSEIRSAAIVLAIGAALIAPPVLSLYMPWGRKSFAKLTVDDYRKIPPGTVGWSLYRFLVMVRGATPPTSGYVSAEGVPEYGIASHANLGHAIQWVARRGTPTDPFWEYIGPQNWNRAFGLLAARDEARAVELADELSARYIVVAGGSKQGGLGERLYSSDGARRGAWPALTHFRHITEGPLGGAGIHELGGRHAAREAGTHDVPYKLFEVVEGAQLEVASTAGSEVEASLTVTTAVGRRFVYSTRSVSGAEGIAHLRLPYSSYRPGDAVHGANASSYRTRGAPFWAIAIDGKRVGRIAVSESAVLGGEMLRFRADQPL